MGVVCFQDVLKVARLLAWFLELAEKPQFPVFIRTETPASEYVYMSPSQEGVINSRIADSSQVYLEPKITNIVLESFTICTVVTSSILSPSFSSQTASNQ